MILPTLLENITDGDLKWWSRYLRLRTFKTETEARDTVYRLRSQSFDAESSRLFADEIPVRRLAAGWKVGKVYRTPPIRLSWEDIRISGNDRYDLYHTAEANGAVDYTFKKEMLPVANFVGPFAQQDRYHAEDGRIRDLAQEIKSNGQFERVIVMRERDGGVWLVEGQHRARAVRWFLRLSSIPCDVIHESP